MKNRDGAGERKVDENLAYFSGKEFGSNAVKGNFSKDSDSKRRSVDWMSDVGLTCSGLALLSRIVLRVMPLSQGPALLFNWISFGALAIGAVFTVVSAVFAVLLYTQDKKLTAGAFGTTVLGIVVLVFCLVVMFC